MAFKCVRHQGKQEVSPPPSPTDWEQVLFLTLDFHVVVNNQDLTAAPDLKRSPPQLQRLLKVS